MLGLFKRTKIEDWEIELLQNVITQMPDKYSAHLLKQINDGLFRGVITGASDIPGFVAFTFNYEVLQKYDNEEEQDYKLSNIKVFDEKSSSFLSYEIYVSSGTINGYSIERAKKLNIDVNNIDVSGLRKVFIGSSDYNRVENILCTEEKSVINPANVYLVTIDNKEFFHIKDMEDGDFIGIDINRNVFKITHDPMEVVKLEKSIVEILKEKPD